MEMRVGVIPLPVHVVLLLVVGYFVLSGHIPTEINMMMAVIAVLGFSCAEIGHRIPLLNQVGGAAIFATFVPSFTPSLSSRLGGCRMRSAHFAAALPR